MLPRIEEEDQALLDLYNQEYEVPSATAGDVALPAYFSNQLKAGVALGDIFNFDSQTLKEEQEKQENFLSQYEPKVKSLFQANNIQEGVEWWKDQAILNSMNQIVPMLGYTTASILGAVPNPVAQVASKLITTATFASQYTANLGDTLSEYEDRKGGPLTDAEKAKAAGVSTMVTMLDYLTPSKVGKDVAKQLEALGGVKGTRDFLTKQINRTKDSLGLQVKKGAKYVGGVTAREMGTEATQKALQIGTSTDPGYLGTMAGLESIVSEAVAAGPTSGIISTPSALATATRDNRNINAARRGAERWNEVQKQARANYFERTGKELTKPLQQIQIPEASKGIFERGVNKLEQATGFKAGTFGKKVADIAAFRPTSLLLDARGRQKTGEGYNLMNKIIQSFVPTGTMSGEKGLGANFLSRKDQYHGEYYKPINEILQKVAKTRGRFLGLGRPQIDPELNEYLIKVLQDRKLIDKHTREDLISKEDLQLIGNQLDAIGKRLGKATGAQFVKNYLSRPVSDEAVRGDKEGFIQSLIESSKQAYELKKGKGTKDFIYQPNDEQGTYTRAQQIADEIIQGRDPLVPTSAVFRKQKARKGRAKEDFEKTRSLEWKNLDDKYRDQDAVRILDRYFSRAATRIASAETFGSTGASGLRKQIQRLVELGDIKEDEVNRIWDLYDAVHGVYRRDVSQGEAQWRLASKALTTVGAITHLGFATLSSLPELIWIGERAGVGNMIATLPKAIKYTIDGIKAGVGRNDVYSDGNQTLANLGFHLNPQMNERLDQMFATDRNAILSAFFRSPFGGMLTQWTNFNRNWAAQAGMMMMNRRAKGMQSGKMNATDKRRMMNELKEVGMTPEEFMKIANLSKDENGNFNINFVDDNFLNKKIRLPNGKYGTVRDRLHPYVYKIVNDVVINPVATNKPLWMSDPSLATIAQLKTFPIVFGNTVMKRILRKLNPKQCGPDMGLAVGAIGAMAMSVAVAMLGEALKGAIRGKQRDLTWIDIGNTAGLTGAFGLLTGSRYGDFTTTTLGPALDGAINTTFSQLINPFIDAEGGGLPQATDNLYDWTMDSLISSLGVPGELMFGGE